MKAKDKKSAASLPRKPAGRISKLAHLIRDRPDQYRRMLDYVRAGAYLHVAAAAIGVTPETVSRWLSKGEKAKSGHYAEFRQDILAAVAEASLVAEVQVKQNKPETWLRCGPRRLLGDEWREADNQLVGPMNVVNTTIVPAPSLADLAAALVELSKAGVCMPVEYSPYSTPHSSEGETPNGTPKPFSESSARNPESIPPFVAPTIP